MVDDESLGILLLADVGLAGVQQGIWRAVSEVNKGNEVTLGVDYTLIRKGAMISTLARLQNIGVSIRIHEFKLISSHFLENVRNFGWRFDSDLEIYLADDDGISFLDLDKIVLITNDGNASIFHPKVKIEILDRGTFGTFNESLISMQQISYYSKYFAIRDLLRSTVIHKEFKACFCFDNQFHVLNERVELDPSAYKGKVK